MSKKVKARRLAKNAVKKAEWKERLARPGSCEVLRQAEANRKMLTQTRTQTLPENFSLAKVRRAARHQTAASPVRQTAV